MLYRLGDGVAVVVGVEEEMVEEQEGPDGVQEEVEVVGVEGYFLVVGMEAPLQHPSLLRQS